MSNELKIAEPQDEPINKQRLPTPADLIILEWLQKGQTINNAEALTRFSNACLRDAVWRLGNAGHIIQRKWVYYENSKGQKKKFKQYFITPPEIKNAGFKTDASERAMKKEGSISEISKKMQQTGNNVPVQVALF